MNVTNLLFCTFLLLPSTSLAALKCKHCKDKRSLDDCSEETCSRSEKVCFLDIRRDGPGYLIDAGCKASCSHHSNYECSECCNHNDCNKNLCRHQLAQIYALEKEHTVDRCEKCVKENNVYNCDQVEKCDQGQICFTQEYNLFNAIYYQGGCIDWEKCVDASKKTFHIDFLFEHLQGGRCCNTTLCNTVSKYREEHGESPLKPTTTPKPALTQELKTTGIDHCMKCYGVLDGGRRKCNETQRCKHGQVCFIQKFNLLIDYYYSGCTDIKNCSVVDKTSFHEEHSIERLRDGRCCDSTGCNVPSIFNFKAPTASPSPKFQCMKCHADGGVGWRCDQNETCSADQGCYVQELEMKTYLPGLPSTYFHGGCINKTVCSTVAMHSVENEHGLSNLLRGECCFNTDCNWKVKRNYEESAPKFHCMKCHADGGVGWKCDQNETCSADQGCYVQELEMKTYLPGLPPTYFHGGCINKTACSTVRTHSLENEHGLSNLLRGECCFHSDCNWKVKKNYEEQFSTTTIKPTTSSTTTTATTTTSPNAGSKCTVCNGTECGDTLTQCPGDEPLCLTTVENDEKGHKSYEKRCATMQECDDKWLTETTMKPECVGFHPDSTYTFNFNCTFCCTTDGCNTDNMPAVKSLYMGS